MKKIFYIILLTAFINPVYSQWTQQLYQNTQIFHDIEMYGGIGFTCGGSSSGTLDARILKTTNYGLLWSQVTIPYGLFLTSISIHGIAVGYSYVLYSTNGGNNWTKTDLPDVYPKAVSFYNYSTGFIVGNSPYILKTTNHCQSFTTYNLGISLNLNEVDHKDGSLLIAMACGANGKIVKTTNGGDNWGLITSPTSETLRSITYLSNNHVFVCGDNGLIFESTNGGTNWVQQLSGTTADLHDIKMVTTVLGYACGTNRTMLKTFNGGDNWYLLNTHPQAYDFTAISAVDENLVYACGSYGVIINTTNGGGDPIGVEPISSETPDKFSLSQNYPNPFNPTTNIEFSIVKSTNVKIVVYDFTGREVSVLTNGFLNAGSYKLTWDGSNFSSGTYFYKIFAGEFIETRKMILIK